MPLRIEVVRRVLWRRRVAAAHAWRDAERAQAVEHSEAIRRILDQAATVSSERRRSA